jgi:hypothetical protein
MIFKFVKKTWVKFPLVMLMLVAFANMSFRVSPYGEVVLNAGTLVPLETIGVITSQGLTAGQTIDFKVRADVKVGEKVVIAAGSIAKAQVTRVNEPKAIGKQGVVELQVKSVQSVDGKSINLSSGSVYKEGEDRLGLSIGLGIFICLLFLLMKGKNAEIAPGYQVDAVVASNTTITVN